MFTAATDTGLVWSGLVRSSLPSPEELCSVDEGPESGRGGVWHVGRGRGYVASSHIQALNDLLELCNGLLVIDVLKIVTEAKGHYHLPKVGPGPCLEYKTWSRGRPCCIQGGVSSPVSSVTALGVMGVWMKLKAINLGGVADSSTVMDD